MSILQISKIQQRSGNLVDLPQLDEAEFGWASDAKRLFIGKTTPNENIEILTSYSAINFSQINGAVGNLNITAITAEDGQVLSYDGTNWVNKGGIAGGLITLGDVSNVKITGGAIGYVLETDGTGNLSWSPKSVIVAYVQNVTIGNGAPGNLTLITTTQDNYFAEGAEVTITDVPGTTQLNGNTYYASIQTSNTFALYTDSGLTTGLNATGYGVFPYTAVTSTDSATNRINVTSSTYFTINDSIVFIGDMGDSTIVTNETYYVKNKGTGWIAVSRTLGGPTLDPGNELSPSANVYASGGRVLSTINSGSGSGVGAAGSNTSIQFNKNSVLGGSASFTYNDSSKLLTLNGNANVGNLNATGIVTATRYISNVATGTTPLQVTSTTRVANLNVDYANVSDYSAVSTQTTGTFYPVLASGSTNGNYALGSNANLSFNALTGNLSTTLLSVTSNANVGNLGTAGLITATGNITGGNLVTGGLLSVTGNANVGNIGATNANLTAITAIGNANVGNLGTAGLIVATGNVTGGNVNTAGKVVASTLESNVTTGTAPFVVASTTKVANLNADLLDGFNTDTTAAASTIVLRNTDGNIAANNITGTLTTASQTNITSVGTLGSLTVTANVISGNVYANSGTIGASLLNGTLTTAAQPNITSVGTLTSLSVTGNISSGNVSTGAITATGNVLLTGANISLGAIANVKMSGGTSGFVIVTDGTGNLSFANPGTIGVQPAGSDTQVQFNDGGALGASSGLTFNKTTTTLNVASNVNSGAMYSTGNITSTANVNANNITVTNNIQTNIISALVATGTAPLIVNSTTQVNNLRAEFATSANTVTNSAQPAITSVGTLTSLGVSGDVSSGGNVSATRFDGSGAGLTNIPGANVSGTVPNATYATSAGSATSATNATNASVASVANSVAWGNVSGRPTALSAFTNDVGYITSPFPAGTRMLFVQTSAPVGWTKDTTTNDVALRVVNGAVGSGGTVNFSAAFTNKTVLGTVGDTALTEAQMPAHRHFTVVNQTDGTTLSSTNSIVRQRTVAGDSDYNLDGSTAEPTISRTSSTGSGQTHTHTFSGSSINLAVRYVDVIIATKN